MRLRIDVAGAHRDRVAGAVIALVDRLGIEMPFMRAVDQVLNQSVDLGRTIANEFAMPFGVETVVLPMLRRGSPVSPPPLESS